MQLVVKIENGAPVLPALLEANLRAVLPALPAGPLRADVLEPLGFALLVAVAPPACVSPLLEAVEVDPVRRAEDGAWLQCWELREREFESPEQRAAAVEMHSRNLDAGCRERRQALLAASDWAMMADAPTDKEAWTAYRAALRDITAQPGYPESVSWPTAPNNVVADLDMVPA